MLSVSQTFWSNQKVSGLTAKISDYRNHYKIRHIDPTKILIAPNNLDLAGRKSGR